MDGGFGRGAGRLVSHKEQVVFRVVQAVLEVADDAAADAHVRSGNDDGRAVKSQQAAVFLEPFHGIQVFEPDGVISGGFQGFGFLVPAVVHVLVKPGDVNP